MKNLYIINPVAGGIKGRLEEIKSELTGFVKTLKDPYEIYVTKAPMDACHKIIEVAENENELRVYACGGDGTLNECVNGAANRKNAAITHYPCGTGNDFLKTFGRDNIKAFLDFQALTEGTIRPLDVVDCDGRYGINICSVGIDARVTNDVHKYSSIPIIGGATGYVVSLVVNVIKGVTQNLRITVNDVIFDKKITLTCACNGRFYGGGFNPMPDAVPDDGILEFLIVEPVSRLKVAQIVGRFAKGRFREFPDVFTHLRGESMVIESDRDFVVNTDGETSLAKKVSFKIVPKGINFIFPADFQFHNDETKEYAEKR